MHLTYSDSTIMGTNPASVDLDTGLVMLNSDVWRELTDYERAIILLHEEGHYKNKSLSEVKADIYAIENYLTRKSKSKKDLLTTIFNLVPNNETNQLRKIEFARNLFYYDFKYNGNSNSKLILDKINKHYPNLYRDEDAPLGRKAGFGMEEVEMIVGGVKGLMEIGLSVWQIADPNHFAQKSQWEQLSNTSKEQMVKSVISAAILAIYVQSYGDWSVVRQHAKLDYTNPNSILGLAYTMLVGSGVLAGATNNAANDAIQASFWARYYQSYALLPAYWEQQVELYRPGVEAGYAILPFWVRIWNSKKYHTMVIVIGVLFAALLIYYFI